MKSPNTVWTGNKGKVIFLRDCRGFQRVDRVTTNGFKGRKTIDEPQPAPNQRCHQGNLGILRRVSRLIPYIEESRNQDLQIMKMTEQRGGRIVA